MIKTFTLPLLAGTSLCLASAALADPVAPSQAPQTVLPTTAASAEATPAEYSVDLLAPVADSELDKLRGGQELVITNQTLVAVTSGNTINGNYTAGDISLSDFALSNFNGVGNLLINTGGQVSLQTGMNLTINVNK